MDFRNKYNQQDFVNFLLNFLPNDFERNNFEPVPATLNTIKEIKLIGRVPSLNNLYVYEIRHLSENDPRVTLSRETFKVMRQYGVHNALAVFISDNSPNYRFSLVTIKFKLKNSHAKKEYSNPKRFSFYLGPNAKTHTPYEYLIQKGKIKNLEDLEKRFSIETVNQTFYESIAILFTKLTGGKRKIRNKNYDEKGKLNLPSTTDDTIRKEFAVRLIGRLVFAWFLKRKQSKNKISLLSEDILSTNAVKQNKQYYHSILEPLFFQILNKPVNERRKEYQTSLWSQIPFLNGGLFSPHQNDFYDIDKDLGISRYINTLKIPNDWFISLFEIFDTYNFTIDENTSIDIELSIDPEMLGRIFENLLADINPITGESAQKSTGSYYTPRIIVEYMVDEGLKQFLLTNTKLDESTIQSLLSYEDEEIQLSDKEKYDIIEALDKIKIIDPAVGSGAFPMGILNKMSLILQKIDPDSKKWMGKKITQIKDPLIRQVIQSKQDNYNYIHKLGIIQNSIYGVDIQPIAVEISKLRFFLSLIVDENINDEADNRGIQPLPNLEFKFVCANSLIGLTTDSLTDHSNSEHKSKLKELRDEYLNSYGKEKKNIKIEFRKIQSIMLTNAKNWGGDESVAKLATWNPFSDEMVNWFDPDWMFGIKKFDIIIANPPYLGEKGHKEIFQQIKKGNLGEFYTGKMDLFYFFFHLALNICAENSYIIFITTNYYITASGAKKLRMDIKKRAEIQKLINFNELKIFESALGQHNMITFLKKRHNKKAIAQTIITNRQGFATHDILTEILNNSDNETHYCTIMQKDLYDGEECYIRLIANDPIQKILDKIKKQGELLSNHCRINNGIHSEADYLSPKKYNLRDDKSVQAGSGIYVLNNKNNFDHKQILKIISSEKESAYLKAFFKNSDIYKWSTSKDTDKKIIYLNKRHDNINHLPFIKKHLSMFKTIIDKSSDNSPYLHRPKTESDFLGPKIVVPQRSKTNTFGYNEIPWYASADVYFITTKNTSISLKYILALLNSKLYYLWLYHRGKRKGETLELYQKPLSEIPIKKIHKSEQAPFIKIVDKILATTNDKDYLTNESKQKEVEKYENQINQMVYQLYNLTDKEIKTIEQQK